MERGRDVKHIVDYPTMNDDLWDMECKGELTKEELLTKQKQSRSGIGRRKDSAHFTVNDLEHLYQEAKPFDWIRGYQVGGRSLIWGRKSFRLSDLDFEANLKDGHGVDWPIRYKDIAPWYSYVEKHAGIAGHRDGIPHLLDGEFTPPFELTDIPVPEKLGEAFLPKTESPGAMDVGAHFFVDLFMSKVSTSKDQKVVLDGFKAWKRSSDAITGIPIGQAEHEDYVHNLEFYFVLTPAERQNVDKLFFTNDPMNDEQLEQRTVYGFLKKFKSLLMLGYYASEEIGENTLSYLPVPGDYEGCVPVSSVGNIWSIE